MEDSGLRMRAKGWRELRVCDRVKTSPILYPLSSILYPLPSTLYPPTYIPQSLMSKRNHRIDLRRAPRGDVTRQQRHGRE